MAIDRSRTRDIRAYRQIFRAPPIRRFFARSVPGRFGVAAASLAVVVAAQQITGSYQTAGLAAAVLAVTNAVCSPVGAWFAARHGQRVVLRIDAGLVAVAGALLPLAALRHSSALVILAVAVFGAGMPQVGAIAVSRWSTLLPDAAQLRTALAIESMMTEITFLGGPILISAIVAAGGAGVAPSCCAGLIVVSALLLAAARDSEPPHVRPHQAGHDNPIEPDSGAKLAMHKAGGWGKRRLSQRLSQRRAAPVIVLIALVNFAMGGFFGSTQVSVVATATDLGGASVATAMYALMSVTSLLAGFGYGAIHRKPVHARLDLLIGTAALCALTLLATGTGSLLGLGAMLLFSGAFVAPSIIASGVIAERSTPAEHVNGVFTVLSSLSSAGSATGAATAGVLIETVNPSSGFLAASGATCLGAVAAGALIWLSAMRGRDARAHADATHRTPVESTHRTPDVSTPG